MIKRFQFIPFILLGLMGGVSLTCAKGISFLLGNQTSYFLYGLRLYDSTFIPRDWYTWKVFHHEFAFGYLLYFLQKLGPLHVTALMMQFVLMTALSFGLLITTRRFCRYPAAVFVILVTWVGLISGKEIGLGWQQLISGYLQPSEVATSLMILGLAFLFNRRYLVSGVILGMAGLFHSAYLCSFAPTILLTALASGILGNRKSLLSFGAPLVLLWGILVLVVGNVLLHSVPPTEKIMAIQFYFRNPGDFIISNWPMKWTINWLIWAGIGAMGIFMTSEGIKYRELRVSFLAAIGTCILSVILLVFINIPSITGVMLWRVAPWALLLGIAVVLDRCIHLCIRPGRHAKKDKIFIISVCIAGVVLISHGWGPFFSKMRFLWIVAIPLAVVAYKTIYKWRKDLTERSKSIPASLFFIMVVIMILHSFHGLKSRSHNHFLQPVPFMLDGMEKWVRENTPEESIFIIPPEMEYMRIRARRAVVVDSKSVPQLPSDIEEWYQRLCDVCGFSVTDPATISEEKMLNGYRYLDADRAKLLHQRYGANYVVVLAKDHVGDISGLIERFRNEDYCVFEIPSE